MRQAAFTLFEMMVVIALIGVIAAILIPRITNRKPNTEWLSVTREINNLLFFARQEAIAQHQIQRLVFNGKQTPHVIFIEHEAVDSKNPEHKHFKPLVSTYAKTRYELPDSITISGVLQGKRDLFAENNSQGYCYIVPDGLVQESWIRLTRFLDEKKSEVTLQVMPFFGECTYVEGHLKPE